MLVRCSTASPLLVRVTFCEAVVVPRLVVAKVSEVVESEATGPVPVPESETEGAMPGALLVTVRVAVRAPRAIGVKVTLMVQEALTASVLDPMGQLLVRAKSPGFVPPSVKPLMLRGAEPVLLTVIVCTALVVPTIWLA
jgi:hypothetical protein